MIVYVVSFGEDYESSSVSAIFENHNEACDYARTIESHFEPWEDVTLAETEYPVILKLRSGCDNITVTRWEVQPNTDNGYV